MDGYRNICSFLYFHLLSFLLNETIPRITNFYDYIIMVESILKKTVITINLIYEVLYI